MSVANPLWGTPASTVNSLSSAWMSARPPGEVHGEKTTAAVAGLEDLCSQSRRRHRVDRHVRGADDLVWASVWTSHPAAVTPRASVLGVTAHPNAEWLARQLTEACGWDEPPRYLIRDRDGAYGAAF
jgi:hypothetical protein